MDIVDSAINFVGSAIGSANAAALQALGSIAKTNTFDNNPKAYANCGSWQKGSTDFVAISGHDVVLGTWGNFGDTATIPVPAHLSEPIKKFFSNSNQKAFLVKSLTFRSGKSEASKQATQLTKPNELYVIVPDCHITLFKGWSLDGFHKPRLSKSGKPSKNVNWSKYPKYRVSLEKDFSNFLHYAQKQSTAQVIQLGDLLDVWHVQWMYEKAYDIYHSCITAPTFARMCSRFPVELLGRPHEWPNLDEEGYPQTRYSWWKFLPKYLGSSEGTIRNDWRTKVAPLDVIAIIFWGTDIDEFATPLNPKEFKKLKTVLSVDLKGTCPSWHHSTVPKDESYKEFWVITKKLKESVCLKPEKQGEPLHFLNHSDVEERIRQQYPIIEDLLKSFSEKKGTTFLRGNHDCDKDNLYLQLKFGSSKELTATELRSKMTVKGKAPLDDEAVGLGTETSLCCGFQGRICIEHGDAWDYQNNDQNYFRFSVGTPWSGDHKGDAIDWLGEKVATAAGDDGGYHMPRGSYNDAQLENPGSTLLRFKSWLGDFGLDPPANARAQAIFLSTNDKAKKVRLVVMGHTHIPKLEGDVRKYLEPYSTMVRELLE